MNKNYEFYLNTNVDQFIGQWIAICDKKIVSHGTDVKKVFNEAKQKCPQKRPLVTRVPDKEAMIF